MNVSPETSRRKLQLGRFVIGLLLSSIGISSILLVGINLVQISRARNELVLPLVGGSVVAGIMLLGGGFGLMATSAAGFDEEEFDRLAGMPYDSCRAKGGTDTVLIRRRFCEHSGTKHDRRNTTADQ